MHSSTSSSFDSLHEMRITRTGDGCCHPAGSPSLTKARLCVVFAAILWSTSGAVTKVLCENTGLGLNEPSIDPLAIAFWRVVLAAAVFLPGVRRCELTFRPA